MPVGNMRRCPIRLAVLDLKDLGQHFVAEASKSTEGRMQPARAELFFSFASVSCFRRRICKDELTFYVNSFRYIKSKRPLGLDETSIFRGTKHVP